MAKSKKLLILADMSAKAFSQTTPSPLPLALTDMYVYKNMLLKRERHKNDNFGRKKKYGCEEKYVERLQYLQNNYIFLS